MIECFECGYPNHCGDCVEAEFARMAVESDRLMREANRLAVVNVRQFEQLNERLDALR